MKEFKLTGKSEEDMFAFVGRIRTKYHRRLNKKKEEKLYMELVIPVPQRRKNRSIGYQGQKVLVLDEIDCDTILSRLAHYRDIDPDIAYLFELFEEIQKSCAP